MSDSEQEVVIAPMPRYRIRFTDMPVNLQEKAIRRKFSWNFLILTLVCDKADKNEKNKLDKEVASEI